MAKKEAIAEKKENTEAKAGIKTEKVLIENFVSLQHVMTNLVVKFDNLSSQISKLLELFEISAKVLAEKGITGEEKIDRKVAEKLDNLLEQNKIIAKGIALLHEKNQEPQYAIPSQTIRPIQQISPQRPQYNFYKNPVIKK
jgi:hypothetical protein